MVYKKLTFCSHRTKKHHKLYIQTSHVGSLEARAKPLKTQVKCTWVLYGLTDPSFTSCGLRARVETVLVYHHTCSSLCGKILTTPIFLLVEHGFLTNPHLGSKKRKRRFLKPQLFSTVPRFSKTR